MFSSAQVNTTLGIVSSKIDTVPSGNDSIPRDTTFRGSDTTDVKKNRNEDFRSKIEYSADTLEYSADNKVAYLRHNAKVTYEDIELTADYIEYDFSTSQVRATPLKDSAGMDTGIPSFKQGGETFAANAITHNFKTKRTLIQQVSTAQGEGFLHAEKTKRHEDGSVDLKRGIYTTCDLPHPHFGIVLTKGKVLPNDKIVSGPAYMMFEDVPLPIGIPFGFFPNSRKSSVSGVIIPAYGESASEGFYLRDGGYYFALSDYYDLAITGDVYSKGTWGTSARSNYKKNYKFAGAFDFNYNVAKQGIIGIDSGVNQFSKQTYLSLNWNHAQLPTANPNQTFNANVNYSSTGFDRRFNYYGREGVQNLLQTSKSSSISYTRKFNNANLSVNLRGDQNNVTENVNLTLPVVRFDASKIYLFPKDGEPKWYNNIYFNYNSELANIIRGHEDSLFTRRNLRRAQNGFQHGTSFSTNVRFLKYFNFSPSLGYQGRVFTKKFIRDEKVSINENGKKVYSYTIDTISGLSYAHAFSPSASLSFTPTVYGMLQFGPRSAVNAVRHVVTPSASVSFVPGIKELVPNYFRTYKTSDSTSAEYSIYDGNYYSTPRGSTRSASISFNLGNNLEAKVRSAKDTITGFRKIVIIQSLNFSASYNPYALERKLSTISWNGVSPIFKGFSINYNGVIDPYDIDSLGRSTNTYYWKKHKGIGRLTSAGVSFGYTFKGGGGSGETQQQQPQTGQNQQPPVSAQEDNVPKRPVEDFTYFQVPWSFTFNYNLNYTKYGFKKEIIQSLTFNGNVTLTKKWQISFNSGYDFKAKDFSITSVSITRNLHCWNMSVNFIPFGPYRYYEFRILAASALLQDLKYEQRRDYYDNPEYRSFY